MGQLQLWQQVSGRITLSMCVRECVSVQCVRLERMGEIVISVHKKVENMEAVCYFFYPIVCYIYLLSVFWVFGSFIVVDSP